MGCHYCEYCKDKRENTNKFSNESSVEFFLPFSSGRIYQVPGMILHYIADHEYQPPDEFISDVMCGKIMSLKSYFKKFPQPLSEKSDEEEEETSEMSHEEFKAYLKKFVKESYFGEVKIGYLTGPFQAGIITKNFVKKLKQAIEKSGKINATILSFGS